MKNMNKIFFIVVLIVMTSCQKIIQQDTAVLSKHTQAIVDFFLEENEKEFCGDKQLVIKGGYIENDSTYFYLNIWEHDTTVYKLSGKYNGIVHYKGYDISLYGDSWNDFFWTCDTIYEIPDMNSDFFCFYDPVEWNIAIWCNDTAISRPLSEFPYYSYSSLSYEENQRIICNSLQEIIRK